MPVIVYDERLNLYLKYYSQRLIIDTTYQTQYIYQILTQTEPRKNT